jgi:hypothetical protein
MIVRIQAQHEYHINSNTDYDFFSTAVAGWIEKAIKIYSRKGAKAARNFKNITTVLTRLTSAFSAPPREYKKILISQRRQVRGELQSITIIMPRVTFAAFAPWREYKKILISQRR